MKPVPKGRYRKNIADYRELTMMDTMYKLYASIMQRRLEESAEIKNLIPGIQVCFRKGRSSADIVYILNYVVQKELTEERRKVCILFADMKAASVTVDREDEGYAGGEKIAKTPNKDGQEYVHGDRVYGSNKWKICCPTMGKKRSKARMHTDPHLYISEDIESLSHIEKYMRTDWRSSGVKEEIFSAGVHR